MRLFIAGLAVLALCAGVVAQEKDEKTAPDQERKAGGLTPEMRAYLDELRRHDEPKMNAKRVAMQKAEQRRMRLASQAWYGYSNLRPAVNPFPIYSHYAPTTADLTIGYMWYGQTPAYYIEQQPVYYTR
jgi:hypothetical protein